MSLHLGYSDVLHDQLGNDLFNNKFETVQYIATIAITGAIRGTSKEKLYQELGLESLKIEDCKGARAISTNDHSKARVCFKLDISKTYFTLDRI